MIEAVFDLSGEAWSRLQEVLIEALERPREERTTFLREACASDPALCREAESLLEAHTRSGDFLTRLDVAQVGALLAIDDDLWSDSDVGPYRIARQIGRGGMGVVYLAHDTRLQRRVAIKFLPAWLAASVDARERLVAEARAAAALDHPNIGVVHEIGETDEGQPFIAMAYYEGETLAERIRRARLPPGEAIRLIAQTAQGLGAAHAGGCLHCDLKPSNLLVITLGPQSSEGSVVKILDFGIARHRDDGPAARRKNAGTMAYLAPERTRGQPPDVRSDLWSLGVVLYEMLSGRLPFAAEEGRALVEAIRDCEPEAVENLRPDVPPELGQIIRRCLQKDPAHRYQDTSTLLADLRRLDRSSDSASGKQRSEKAAIRVGTTDQAAYEHYLRGRYYADRFDEASVALARTQFQYALDRDPAFAEAWAGLADTYRVFDYLSLLSPHEAAARARTAAERALGINPDLAAAHTSLATVLCDYYREWEGAEHHFRRAIELDPKYPTGRQLYAEYLRDLGRFDEAMEQIRKARELDPLSALYQLVEGTVLIMSRRVEQAIQLYDELMETHPAYLAVHLYRGLAFLQWGRPDEALTELDAYDPRGETPDAVAMRGAILTMLGREPEARRILERLEALSATRYVSPFHRAFVHLGLGEVDRTLDLLEQTVAERHWFVRLFRGDPMFDPLRSHPRFQQLLRTVGFDSPAA